MENCNKHIENLSYVLKFINSIDTHFKDIHDELDSVNNKMCDLEHDIENSNFNACEGYRKAKQLKELRQTRRKLKNEIDMLVKLHEWHQRNKNMEIELFKIESQMKKLKEQQEHWTYIKRNKETV